MVVCRACRTPEDCKEKIFKLPEVLTRLSMATPISSPLWPILEDIKESVSYAPPEAYPFWWRNLWTEMADTDRDEFGFARFKSGNNLEEGRWRGQPAVNLCDIYESRAPPCLKQEGPVTATVRPPVPPQRAILLAYHAVRARLSQQPEDHALGLAEYCLELAVPEQERGTPMYRRSLDRDAREEARQILEKEGLNGQAEVSSD